VDISERALLRAQQRCAALPSVRFARFDIATTPVVGTFDVAVCAEVLYYLHHRGLCAARDHLLAALKPGAHLVLVHPSKDAPRTHPVFERHPSLQALSEQTWDDSTRHYTIALLRKTP
jgi:SAM-dependent methyltransferase